MLRRGFRRRLRRRIGIRGGFGRRFGRRTEKSRKRLDSADEITELCIASVAPRIRKVFSVFHPEAYFRGSFAHADDNRKPFARGKGYGFVEAHGDVAAVIETRRLFCRRSSPIDGGVFSLERRGKPGVNFHFQSVIVSLNPDVYGGYFFGFTRNFAPRPINVSNVFVVS